ncbi:MAG: hypothetical protein Q7T08_13195 [Devosia sp.]|nr:hypothetical protein [Devosia sp.]
MGEAKRRRAMGGEALPTTVFHHTSTLRTNLIWMSGVIELEGRCPPVMHPRLGVLRTESLARRAFSDFPALAWFTTQRNVPKCLQSVVMQFQRIDTGEMTVTRLTTKESALLSLNRIALEFPIAEISVVRWVDHPGYSTKEGADLNRWACEMGDDPSDWYVSEQPVDVMLACAVWGARSMLKPELKRWDHYLPDVRRMVLACRANPAIFIPPSWLKEDEAKAMSMSMGVPFVVPDNDDALVFVDESLLRAPAIPGRRRL